MLFTVLGLVCSDLFNRVSGAGVVRPPRIRYDTSGSCVENIGWNTRIKNYGHWLPSTGVLSQNPEYSLETAIYGSQHEGWQHTQFQGIEGSAISATKWNWLIPQPISKLMGTVIVRRHTPLLYNSIRGIYGAYRYNIIYPEASIAVGWQMIFTSGDAGHISLEIELFTNSNNGIPELADYQRMPDMIASEMLCKVYIKIVLGASGKVYPKYVLIWADQYDVGDSYWGPLLDFPDAIEKAYGLPEDATWLDTIAMRAQIYSTKTSVDGWYKIKCFELKIEIV